MSDFDVVTRMLVRWPEGELPDEELKTNCCERLRRTLIEFQNNPETVGAADLASLVRHVLRHEELTAGGGIELTVPASEGWPSEDHWERAGCTVLPGNSPRTLLISADEWSPEWLEEDTDCRPLEDVFQEARRRHNQEVPADPMLPKELGEDFSTYRCPGQRTAIRSIYLSKAGSTLLVNLPTGAGKSLVAWAPAVTQEGLTVVVVPTIALALDQEQQVMALPVQARGPFAWHSGLSDTDQETIKERVRAGNQQILFASPESLVGGLAPALYQAAESGLVTNFVVDEAHMIAQWGNEFRPEYQAIAGLRRDLLRQSPEGVGFRTVLLTATLTEESYATITTLFGPAEDIEVVSATHLRPEPSYWVHEASGEPDREQKLLELVRHLPRPFIVYATTPKDVERWAELLREDGHDRLATVHGQTPPQERSRVVANWGKGLLDGVIATSAFGLGMDQSDVRAVVHVCIPETVDRFYQEIGRGGRDGCACVSVLLFTDKDRALAKELNRERLIGVEKGLKRWETMFHRRKDLGRGRISLDLRTQPPWIRQDSDANAAWNLRTIVLMARAGLLEIESKAPPSSEILSEVADEDQASELFADYFNSATVTVLSQHHLDPDTWGEKVNAARVRTKAFNKRNLELMEDVLQTRQEMSELLSSIYRVREAGVDVTTVCGGCPTCRAEGTNKRNYVVPHAEPIKKIDADLDSLLEGALSGFEEFCFVSYEKPKSSRRWKRTIGNFARRLVSLGVREIAANRDLLNTRYFADLYRHSPQKFLVYRGLSELQGSCWRGWMLPRLTILEPSTSEAEFPSHLFEVESPMHIVLGPDSLRDPKNPQRRYVEVATHLNLDRFERRLNQ